MSFQFFNPIPINILLQSFTYFIIIILILKIFIK